MTNIVDLTAKRMENNPHVEGAAFCSACSYEWRGVWPTGVVDLECPSCHALRGKSKFDIQPQEGAQIWTCITCGTQLFNLLPDRVHCPGCGKQWGYEELIE